MVFENLAETEAQLLTFGRRTLERLDLADIEGPAGPPTDVILGSGRPFERLQTFVTESITDALHAPVVFAAATVERIEVDDPPTIARPWALLSPRSQ